MIHLMTCLIYHEYQSELWQVSDVLVASLAEEFGDLSPFSLLCSGDKAAAQTPNNSNAYERQN